MLAARVALGDSLEDVGGASGNPWCLSRPALHSTGAEIGGPEFRRLCALARAGKFEKIG